MPSGPSTVGLYNLEFYNTLQKTQHKCYSSYVPVASEYPDSNNYFIAFLSSWVAACNNHWINLTWHLKWFCRQTWSRCLFSFTRAWNALKTSAVQDWIALEQLSLVLFFQISYDNWIHLMRDNLMIIEWIFHISILLS